MDILFICLVILTLILLLTFKNFQSSFGETYNDDQMKYLKNTTSVRDEISNIISNVEYITLIENVPGQTTFNITGDPPTVTKIISEGDTSKLTGINRPELITLATKLITALNTFISIANNAPPDVYTPEKLQTFLLYYNNMLNNTQIILNFLNSS